MAMENEMLPRWVKDYMTKDFSHSDEESGEGESNASKEWKASARRWFGKYLKSIGATDFDFHPMYYEFSAFFRIGERWWYISSNDCRYQIFTSMLIRTASGPKDFTGGRNQNIPYDERFCMRLDQVLGV